VFLAIDGTAILGFVCVTDDDDEKWVASIDNLRT
jgi:hypothetical protein